MNSSSDPLAINSALIGSNSGSVVAAARFSRRLNNYAAAANTGANLSRGSNSTGTSNLLLSSGGSARNHLSASSGSSSNRFGFQLSGGQSGSSGGLSSFIRSATSAMESLGAASSISSGANHASDPIVELLSQLTGN